MVTSLKKEMWISLKKKKKKTIFSGMLEVCNNEVIEKQKKRRFEP